MTLACVPLCRTCDDTGAINTKLGNLNVDACPDCARDAEMRWRRFQAFRQMAAERTDKAA